MNYGIFNNFSSWLLETLYMIPAIIIGLSLHEYAHAKVADLCGDPTPRYMGRVTVDPKAHIDWYGLLCLLLIHFGWGKPVVVNPYNFKKQRRDSIFVGLAGVTMNFAVAVVFSGILKLISLFGLKFMASSLGHIICRVLLEIVVVNLSLLFFNLLPIPPLDGFGVICEIFNLYNTKFYNFVSRYYMYIMMALILLRIPSRLLSMPLNLTANFLLTTVFKVPYWWAFL